MNALSYITNHVQLPFSKLRDNNKVKANIVPENIVGKKDWSSISNDQKGTITRENASPEKGLSSVKDAHNQNVEGAIHIKQQIPRKRITILSVFEKFNLFSLLANIILFVPRYLFLNPLIYVWFILTLPLTLVERGIKLRDRKKKAELRGNFGESSELSPLRSISEVGEEDLSTSDEFFLQRDTIKGSLLRASSDKPPVFQRYKSTIKQDHEAMNTNIFGTKKMGRFLFPKKLIPRSILCNERKKTLVVDLDETLIHSVSRGTTHVNSSQGHLVEVKFSINGISTLYYVHKRPFCDLFLSKVSKWYNIVIFTASMKEYADPVIDWLEGSFQGNFAKRLYRHNCLLRDGVGYIKDLSVLVNANHAQDNKTFLPVEGLHEVIIIDNSPVSYALNVDNAIQVEGWISDPTDTDLLNLLPILEALRYTTDVRNVLALKNGEKMFENV
ncbi:hypothetical protein KAFR_0A01830 [Kazachstania africana CBS 2517]|uniref:FCP1 homology domain-containing protein n=1 Tax=Kazachstania africana (strain ATCC 22294 / BCRC 22015 / CBS 2517 / CECT 1963 / NBRC 1671 / NRRL Y-8276) TaxID=1071382 RepID=H2AMM1_KAZAF|nr:hypothetical protein KAFR_0A01830 [Kazachstania africana CBS 2517]CCF55621.1 hypothetical protein KAFR_0A01830 [Kazachstania africana CBS 2517]